MTKLVWGSPSPSKEKTVWYMNCHSYIPEKQSKIFVLVIFLNNSNQAKLKDQPNWDFRVVLSIYRAKTTPI